VRSVVDATPTEVPTEMQMTWEPLVLASAFHGGPRTPVREKEVEDLAR
jgi:hypothetical protein